MNRMECIAYAWLLEVAIATESSLPQAIVRVKYVKVERCKMSISEQLLNKMNELLG